MTKELEYGKWYPIKEYFNHIEQMDWALVQFKETKSSYMGLPHIAELRDNKWYLQCDDEGIYVKYINEDCEPIAFMLWKPYNEDSSLEAIENANPSEALNDLKELRDYLLRDRVNISSTKYYNTIEQALLKAQKNKNKINKIKKIINQFKTSEKTDYICRMYLGLVIGVIENGK